MRIEDSDEEWDPRIGKEAARTRNSAFQYVRYFFISSAINIAVAFIAVMSRTMPLWLSILISVDVVFWLFFVVLTWSTFSLRMRRAGHHAYDYLGRPPQLRKGIFPPAMLRDVLRFDSCMALKDIPPRGNYVPTYDPGTARILTKRNHPDRAQRQQ